MYHICINTPHAHTCTIHTHIYALHAPHAPHAPPTSKEFNTNLVGLPTVRYERPGQSEWFV